MSTFNFLGKKSLKDVFSLIKDYIEEKTETAQIKSVVTNSDGSIVETFDNHTRTTVFSDDGTTITETEVYRNQKITTVTTFDSDGNITVDVKTEEV
jgi:hypothetical protein